MISFIMHQYSTLVISVKRLVILTAVPKNEALGHPQGRETTVGYRLCNEGALDVQDSLSARADKSVYISCFPSRLSCHCHHVGLKSFS